MKYRTTVYLTWNEEELIKNYRENKNFYLVSESTAGLVFEGRIISVEVNENDK